MPLGKHNLIMAKAIDLIFLPDWFLGYTYNAHIINLLLSDANVSHFFLLTMYSVGITR